MEYDQINQLYLDYLGRPASADELKFYAKRFGTDVDRNETLKFIEGAVKSGEITRERADELKAPLVINYQTVDFMAGQLADQYATQKEAGYSYKNEEDLPKFFRAQAAKLAANGVTSIYDVQQADGGIVNAATGEVIKDVVLRPTWETDPEAYKFRGPVELEDRGKFTRWGKDLSVDGQADYGISFENGVPVYTPFWKDTATKIFGMNLEDAVKTAIALTAAYYGGSYLMGGEAAAGSAAAGTGGAAGAGTGTAISGAGLTSAEMAALKGAEYYGAGTAGLGAGAGATGISLLEGAQFPVEGLKGVASTAPGAAAPFATATTPGLTVPTVPGLSAMGGAQGITIPVAGGTISQLGFVPVGATPVLGDPRSFINDPNLLGNPVFTTDTLTFPGDTSLDLLDTAKTIKSVTDLLGNEQQQLQQQPQRIGGGQARGVDFSPLYQNTIVGLLPGAERYRRSLI